MHRADTRPSPGTSVWWLDPTKLLFFVIIPVFGTAVALGAPLMAKFRAHSFLTPTILMLALVNLVVLAGGSRVGLLLSTGVPTPTRQPASDRVLLAITILAVISILAHLVLLSGVIARPSLLMGVMAGERGAIYVAKSFMTRVPGILSFSQLYMVALPLYGCLPLFVGRRIPRSTTIVIGVLFFIIVLRGFMMADRFAIVEAAIALVVPRLATMSRAPRAVGWYPLFGFVAITILFLIGEYSRSWAYNKSAYDSFWVYGYERLIAYLATATNNGAGVMEITGFVGAPLLTANFYYELPIWEFVANPLKPENPLAQFLRLHANAEFTNPGGLLSPTIDYGYLGGMVTMFIFGVLGGLSYGLFLRRQLIGMLSFPVALLGFMIINQSLYWTDSRTFFPLLLMPFIVSMVSIGRKA